MNKSMPIIDWASCDIDKKKSILSRPIFSNLLKIRKVVTQIITDVENNGDQALYNYTKIFDQFSLNSIKIKKKEIIDSEFIISEKIKKSINVAVSNIFKFHKSQMLESVNVETQPGVFCQQIVRPIQSIGLYIPAGSAPLISTVLMLAIPANLVGCKNIILCSPPPISSEILYASKICGIYNIFQIGGAQAISAMAFGTKTVPKVNKIFGPGNIYVTEAKLQVNMLLHDVSIDMLAGPSEILVIADSYSNAKLIAADLLSQAEHGNYSQAIFVTPDINLAQSVKLEMYKQLKVLSKKDTIIQSLRHSSIIVTKSLVECFEVSNLYAPEHLIIQCKNFKDLLKYVINAGSIFLGKWSTVAGGDYVTGTNHVLPTYGSAVVNSGLTVNDYQKKISVQEVSKEGFLNISSDVISLSKIEQMDAHENSIKQRLFIS